MKNLINSFNVRKRLRLVFILVIPLTLSGCWSAHEIHDVAIINVMGIDVTENGDFEVSTVVVRPDALFSQTYVGGASGDQNNQFLIETATGRTIFEAMGKLSGSIAERMYLGHLNVIVFGKRAAQEKMTASVDYFRRGNDFRPNIQFLVTKGKAKELIKTAPEFNTTIGLEIIDMTKSNRYTASKMIHDISQFSKAFASDTTDPITAVIDPASKLGIEAEGEQESSDTNRPNKSTEKTANNTGEQQKKIVSLNGTAVFKGGSLKGFLDEKETRGLLWIRGEIQNEIVILDCGNNKNGAVSVIIRDANSQFTPHLNEEKKKITVHAQVEAAIGEVTCSNLHLDSDTLDQLNRQLEEVVLREATTTLNKVQKQWQSDVFGFGQSIYRKHPDKWEQMKANWRNGGLKDLKVDIKVRANITRYGLLKDPSNANESR